MNRNTDCEPGLIKQNQPGSNNWWKAWNQKSRGCYSSRLIPMVWQSHMGVLYYGVHKLLTMYCSCGWLIAAEHPTSADKMQSQLCTCVHCVQNYRNCWEHTDQCCMHMLNRMFSECEGGGVHVCVIRIQEVAHEWPHVSAPRRTGSVLQLQLAFVPDTVPLSVSLSSFCLSLLCLSLSLSPGI